MIRPYHVSLLLFALASTAVHAQTSTAGHYASGKIASSIQSEADPQLQAIASEIERGIYSKAESDARTYLHQQPDSAAGHNLLGYVLYRENKPKDSLAEYTAGARLRSPDADDLAIVAMDYILLADYPDANKWLAKATEWEPENALYWYYLGRTRYNENRFQEAITAFDRVLRLKPRDIRAEYNLGLAFAGLGRAGDAETAYKTAIAWEKSDAEPDPQPYLDLGLLLAQHDRVAQAAHYLEIAVALDAKNPKAREALGRNYEQLKELAKAESQYKAAIALAPEISALHFELGRVYQKEKLDGLAREEFARCAKLNKAHSTESNETPNLESHR